MVGTEVAASIVISIGDDPLVVASDLCRHHARRRLDATPHETGLLGVTSVAANITLLLLEALLQRGHQALTLMDKEQENLGHGVYHQELPGLRHQNLIL